jgi:PIN domain nuclease of toxin-antitoxin system
VFSCWEIGKLVELGRMHLPYPTEVWVEKALLYPGIQLVHFTPEIAVAASELPGEFHRDPADQILVATARHLGCPIVTADRRILSYRHVKAIA